MAIPTGERKGTYWMATLPVELLLAQLLCKSWNRFIHMILYNRVCTAGMGVFQSMVLVSEQGSVYPCWEIADCSAICVAFLKEHVGEFKKAIKDLGALRVCFKNPNPFRALIAGTIFASADQNWIWGNNILSSAF